MLKLLSLFLIITVLVGCSEKCFRHSRVLVSSRSIHKLIDDYFKLRKNGYFEYSKRMLGFTKMAVQKGSYVLKGDTLYLRFCENLKGEDLTGWVL